MKTNIGKIKYKKTIIALIIFILFVIVFFIWSLFFTNNTPDLAPKVEENTQQTEKQDKLDQPEGGGAVSITYSNKVSIDLSKKTATFMFENPGRSNQDMVLEILIEDNVIVKSGTLKPGNKVTNLDVVDNVKLSQGTYDGKFNVLFYDSETGEKEIVNTTIPVNISVSK